jgi:hypothetical protein
MSDPPPFEGAEGILKSTGLVAFRFLRTEVGEEVAFCVYKHLNPTGVKLKGQACISRVQSLRSARLMRSYLEVAFSLTVNT